MKSQGQLFSIDFIMSVLLVTVAIALLLQYMEFSAYASTSAASASSLAEIAIAASDRIVNSKEFTCELVKAAAISPGGTPGGTQQQPIEYLPNCIDLGKIKCQIDKFGVPPDYKFKLELGSISCDNCTGNCGSGDHFSVTRKVVTYTGKLGKDDFEKCINGQSIANCPQEGSLKITVWST